MTLTHAVHFLHFLAVGCWLGCYLTEAVVEYLSARNGQLLNYATAIHEWIDRMVEIPAFVLVLATGIIMLNSTPVTPLLLFKIGFALLTIAINVACVVAVRRRRAAMERGDQAQQQSLTKFVHWTFLGLLPGLVPLYLGGQAFLARLP
jgi:putative copper export protein